MFVTVKFLETQNRVLKTQDISILDLWTQDLAVPSLEADLLTKMRPRESSLSINMSCFNKNSYLLANQYQIINGPHLML